MTTITEKRCKWGRKNVGDRGRLQEQIEAMLDEHWFSNGRPAGSSNASRATSE